MDSRNDRRRPPRVMVRMSRRIPVRAFGLALAAVLLISLLAPLASPVSASASPTTGDEATVARQDDEEAQDANEDDQGDGDEAVETPIETPIAIVTETPDAGFSADLQADPFTSGIVVFIRQCIEAYAGDFQQYDLNCTGAHRNVTFDVYGGGGLSRSGVDYLAVAGLPAGQYTIREHIPPDYREPAVF